MDYVDIHTDEQLQQYCPSLQSAGLIGFDTEFVSEDTYTPDLCLIQVVADGELAVIDTKTVDDLTPFWNCLAADGHETVVHAAREEFLFCHRSVQQPPAGLLDLQIAAGLAGFEYPASYGNLISRLLGQDLPKGETRTDWRRRPLTQQQIDYALKDVIYLEPLRDALYKRLDKLNRRDWLVEEMQTWQDNLLAAMNHQRWRRVSGVSGLSPRSMAIVRELWQWREAEALRRNTPPKRVLRDDLIVEMARRKTADARRIGAVRGMNRRDLKPYVDQFADCVAAALDLPGSELPRSNRKEMPAQLTVLGQFLATALGGICRKASIAPSLVATVQDVRDLIAHRLGFSDDEQPPRLARGWRAELVGHLIEDLLAGRVSIRIADPLSDSPLVFDKTPS